MNKSLLLLIIAGAGLAVGIAVAYVTQTYINNIPPPPPPVIKPHMEPQP